MHWTAFTLFGALFGFVLSRSRVTDYDAIAGMFRLTDLHLFGVIGAAIAVSALGLWIVRRGGNRTVTGQAVEGASQTLAVGRDLGRPRVRGRLGAERRLTGHRARPGGRGKAGRLLHGGGILVGTYVFGALRSGAGAPTTGAPRPASAS
jgi:hypothetical protein